jgi:hypothetical protein
METKTVFITKSQLARMLDSSVRARIVETAEPDAFLKWSSDTVPLYRIELVEQLKGSKEVK